jgi:predicted DNA-binding transcriptional regulator YafY
VEADHLEGVVAAPAADARVETDAGGQTFVDVAVSNQAAFRSFVLGFLEHAEIVDPPEVRAAMIEWLETVAAGAA